MDPILKQKLLDFSRRAHRVMADAAEVVVHIQSKPSLLTIAAVAARVADTYITEVGNSKHSYFQSWKQVGCSQRVAILAFHALTSNDALRKVSSPEGVHNYIGVFDGTQIGITHDDEGTAADMFMMGSRDEKDLLRQISALVWAKHGDNLTVEVTHRKYTLGRDNASSILASKTGQDLHNRIQKFIDAGHPRSVLLHGEPGTGKSSMMQYIAARSGGRTLRTDLSTLSPRGGIVVCDIAEFLQPHAVLVDDLDRASDPDKLLRTIEGLRTRLLMCSVNDISKLDRATLRPGRFDEIIHVDHLDDDVISAFLGPNLPPEVDAQIRVLPIAYIHEFCRRRDVLGVETALADVQELVARTGLVAAMASSAEEADDVVRYADHDEDD